MFESPDQPSLLCPDTEMEQDFGENMAEIKNDCTLSDDETTDE